MSSFKFRSGARKDLIRSLVKADAREVPEAVIRIEALVEQYKSRFIARNRFPDMKYLGEANRLFVSADNACHAFENMGRRTRRRLEGERLERNEQMSLQKYAESMNDVCMFALQAMGEGDRPIRPRLSAADQALRSLTVAVLRLWRKHTRSNVPIVAQSRSPTDTSWRRIRDLQHHPLWIVYDALGIFLDANAINSLVKARE
jgi:hypothetical protein